MSNIIEAFSQLQKQETLEEIDLELCRFLQEQESGVSEDVLKAAGLVSYLYRRGDVCLLLDEYAGQPLFDEFDERKSGQNKIWAPALEAWQKALNESQLVGTPGSFRPLILDDQNRLYLHKLWHHEQVLAKALLDRCQPSTDEVDLQLLKEGLERLFGFNEQSHPDWQRIAAALAVKQRLSIISGGPGTGKTSTVVRILALLVEQGEARGQMTSIALTAPTGKAAARLQDAIRSAKDELAVQESVRQVIPDEAMTLHQLLGARRHTSRFRHNKENPLPHDVIIVDEVSMVDQTLMSRLMQALLNDTKLILLGDKDQLASVEAGSVLGDICLQAENTFTKEATDWLQSVDILLPNEQVTAMDQPLTDHVTLLTHSYRFDEHSGIGHLAKAVNRCDADESLQLIGNERYRDISLIEYEGISDFKSLLLQKTQRYYQQLQDSKSPEEAFDLLGAFRILAAHRKGPWGIRYINQLIEYILQEKGNIPKYARWYAGKPVIINVNDYSLGLYNGDTGICLPDEKGELRIYFQQGNTVRAIAPSRLPDHNRAYALTVHKSQGSEFDNVLFVLPDKISGIVSRELIYTAITRARTEVSIWATKQILKEGIEKRIKRASGLSNRLWHNRL